MVLGDGCVSRLLGVYRPFFAVALTVVLLSTSISVSPRVWSAPGTATVSESVVSQANLLMTRLRNAKCDPKAFAAAKKDMEAYIASQRRGIKATEQAYRDAKTQFTNTLASVLANAYGPKAPGQQLYYGHFVDSIDSKPTSGLAQLQSEVVNHLSGLNALSPDDAKRLDEDNATLQVAGRAYAAIKPLVDFLKQLEQDARLIELLECTKPTASTPAATEKPSDLLAEPSAKPATSTNPLEGLNLLLETLKRAQTECPRTHYDQTLAELERSIEAHRQAIRNAETAFSQALLAFERAALAAFHKSMPTTPSGESPTFAVPFHLDAIRNEPNAAGQIIQEKFRAPLDAAGVTDTAAREAFEAAAKKLQEAAAEWERAQQRKKQLNQFERDLLRYPYLGKACPPLQKEGEQTSMLPKKMTTPAPASVEALVSVANFTDEQTGQSIDDVTITVVPHDELLSVAVFRDDTPDDESEDPDDEKTPLSPGDVIRIASAHYQPRQFTVPEDGFTEQELKALAQGMLSPKPLRFVVSQCQDAAALVNIQKALAAQGIQVKASDATCALIDGSLSEVVFQQFGHPHQQWYNPSQAAMPNKPVPMMLGGANATPAEKPTPSSQAGEGILASASKNPLPPSSSPNSPNPGTGGSSAGSKPTPAPQTLPLQPGQPGWFEAEQPREGLQNPVHSEAAEVIGSWGQPYTDNWAQQRVMGSESVALPAAPITVAVIDSGVDTSHPALDGQLWVNTREIPDNGLDDDGNGYIDDIHGWNFMSDTPDVTDDNGHGTMVAGIIAAKPMANAPVSGVFPSARIMPLKVTDFQNKGGSIGVAKAIAYAVNNGATVINLSVGGQQPSWVEVQAVRKALQHNVFVVAAAGNNGQDATNTAPASLPGVLVVGASDQHNNHALFSNWGKGIDVVAPGTDVVSLRARQTDFLQHYAQGTYQPGQAITGPSGRYYRASGSSFAAPFATAIVAAIQSESIQKTGQLPGSTAVYNQLVMGAQDIAWPGRDMQTGYGLVSLSGALNANPNVFVDVALDAVRTVKAPDDVYVEIFGTLMGQGLKSAWLELTPTWEPHATTRFQEIPTRFSQMASHRMLLALPVSRFKDSSQWTLRLVAETTDGSRYTADYQMALK